MRSFREFRIVGDGVDAAAHQDELFRERRKLRINHLSKSEIRQRAALVNGDFMRKLVDHANQEMRCIFMGRFGGWRALRHGGNFLWAMNRMAEIPRALIND